MASRVSSVSSMSRVSSIDRRTVDSYELSSAPAATASAHDAKQPSVDHRAVSVQVNETVTVQPLLTRSDSDRHEDVWVDHEVKDPLQAHQGHYGTKSWYYDWWFWEVTGALLSLGSTVAIIVMLAVCNNGPLPVLRYGITLNAMLSVLSTIAKVSL